VSIPPYNPQCVGYESDALQFKSAVSDLSLRDRIVDNLSLILSHLHAAVSAFPHKNGVDQWHAALLTHIISQWYDQQYSEEFMNMLVSMFPSTAGGEPVLDLGTWLDGQEPFGDDYTRPLMGTSHGMHGTL